LPHNGLSLARTKLFTTFRRSACCAGNRCGARVSDAQTGNSPYRASKMVLDEPAFVGSDSTLKQPLTREVAVNKSQLVDKIVADTALGKREVEKVIGAFITTVQESVKKGEKVSLPGFGGWSQTQRKARTARNPRTGAAVRVPAGKGVKFTVGATFKRMPRPRRPRRGAETTA